ncbi:peptidase M4 [Longispora fulva]|uniref:Neutral metalloproteinase n=1 Tax=Longispora fulva TaxID=619741 RepID=A0A8J7GM01_9ACTN|nr:M4 family metallopeptidase [Longispora fulva]MBG6140170.1 Zn-dependent metalloprotease [Longispora fulva]GIG57453.1 peptidase M4 [Longispora fulva]
MKRTLAAAGAVALFAGMAVGVASMASATPQIPNQTQAIAQANSVLSNRAAIRGTANDQYKVYSSRVDAATGATHVRYTRQYNGLRVYGGDFVVHNAPGGALSSVSNALNAPLNVSTTPAITADAAKSSAEHAFVGTVARVGTPELMIDAADGTGVLAFETVVEGMNGATPSKLHVISDARTGAVRGSFDEIETINGTGNSLYSGTVTVDTTQSGSTYTMIDPSHGNNNTCDMNNGTSTCTNFTDADNTWGTGTNANRQSAGVDAHFGAAVTFDYYKNVHGRNGIFGNGTGVPSRVHYSSNYVNAFWDGAQMTYGDGNGKPLVSLDVAGHEMSHGVTENVVAGGLTYSGESGGLNEATSDIFGTMVEFYANTTSDPGDYDIGEKIDINGNGTPLRYMYNPALDGSSHGCWSTSTKNVDVHYSSGVANHFYFNLAEGTGATAYGTSPVCGSAPAVVGIGRAKAEKIWFKALDAYFTSNTSYVNTSNPSNTARAYSLTAASDLYGNCSTEYKAVQAAWTAVNVAGSDTPCGGTPTSSPTSSPTASPTGSPTTCAAVTNGTDVAIPDHGAAVTSTITITGCARNASATTKVAVVIPHTYRGDIRIDLVGPNGTSYRLKTESINDSAANINTTYTVNVSTQAANGTWTLKVQDMYSYDTGKIDSWTLTV